MPDEQPDVASAARERSAHLILYVSPESRLSIKARRNLENVLSGYDPDAVRLEVRDVTRDALQAEADRVVFTPTLLVRGPADATAWVVGDLADPEVIVNLLRMGGVERSE